MTAQRRSRNGVTGRKKQRQSQQQQQQQQRQRRRSQSTTDEESSDEGSITRCLCGETHNSGLMVQCDKCEVWQHCECMGLAEEDIPDQYYCEECKPENHASSKLPNGRTRRSYSSEGKPALNTQDKKAPKKRMTMNSQEASLSLEDVLAVRQALGLTYNNARSSKSPSTSPTTAYDEPQYVPGLSAKRKRQESSSKTKAEPKDIKQDPVSPPALPPISEAVIANGPDCVDENKDKKQTMDPDEDDTAAIKPTPAPRSTKVKRNAASRSKVVTPNENPRTPTTDSKPSGAKATDKKGRQGGGTAGRRNNNTNSSTTKRQNNKPRSRTSTPQPNESSSPLMSSTANQFPEQQHHQQHHYHYHRHLIDQQQQQQQQQQQPFTKDVGCTLFDHFSKESRVASSPAKIRYPTSRMTISEMNRRAKQILEYITSLQVEMANKSSTFGSNTNEHEGKIGKSIPDLPASSQQHDIHPITTSTPRSKSNIHNNSSDHSAVDAFTGCKNKEKHPVSIVIPEVRYHDGPSSSLSSASTIPLDENNPGSPRMDPLDDDNNGELSQAEEAISKNKKKQQDETSLDIMDMLTGELIKFQRRFGTGSYSHRRTQSHQNEASLSSSSSSSTPSTQQQQLQDEGRVTRSGNNGNGVRLLS